MGTKAFPKLELSAPTIGVVSEVALRSISLQDDFRLPRSYRDFAQQFGYGLLCKLLIIYVPMLGDPKLKRFEGDSLPKRHAVLKHVIQQGVEANLFEYEPDGTPELVKQLVPFGISENGHIIAWNPKEATGAEEFAIYVIGSKLLSVKRAATDLYDFVEKCLDNRVREILGSGYKPLPLSFDPRPEKEPRPKLKSTPAPFAETAKIQKKGKKVPPVKKKVSRGKPNGNSS